MEESCKHGSETSNSIKAITSLTDYQDRCFGVNVKLHMFKDQCVTGPKAFL